MLPGDYLSGRLVAAGCDGAVAKSMVASLETAPDGSPDHDGRRMVACLAIDVHTGAIDVARVHRAVEACVFEGTSGRAALGRHLCAGAATDFNLCVSPLPEAELHGGGSRRASYASVMRIEKFIYLFRSDEPSTIGALDVAREVDFLKAFGGTDGVREDTLSRPMCGVGRPITWITAADLMQEECTNASNPAAAASILSEKLGLPWPTGMTHHMVAVYYPVESASFLVVGQPHSVCVTWNDPGAFVTAPSGIGWGRTCGRRDASHTGLPERVHDRLEVLPNGAHFRAVYVGPVLLQPLDRGVARTIAENRWANIAPHG